MRASGDRADAGRRLPILLYLQGLRGAPQAEARGLLRVLFLRLGAVPAGPDRTALFVSRIRSIFSWLMLCTVSRTSRESTSELGRVLEKREQVRALPRVSQPAIARPKH